MSFFSPFQVAYSHSNDTTTHSFLIIHYSSLCGFSNRLALRNWCDECITDVEQFVREDLLELLSARWQQMDADLTITDRMDFFGIYYNDTSNFQFSAEEITQIVKCKQLSDQCCDLTEVTNGLARLEMDDKMFSNDSRGDEKQNEFDWSILYSITPPSTTHANLIKLLKVADINLSRDKAGFRFDENIKRIFVFLRMLSGRLTYETIQRNFELVMPSITAIDRYIHRSNFVINEGVLRSDELLNYLQQRKQPLIVSLSEDATRIENRVQYDKRTNQLIGFTLPTNPKNGMPTPFVYKARSSDEIIAHFSSGVPTSHFVNTIMANPISGIPPFCLLIYGSDSRYTSDEVVKRWSYISGELEKLGISVLTFASDSDPRYNTAMKRTSLIGCVSDVFKDCEWFSYGHNQCPFYIQDVVHLTTKLRNQFLKTMKNPRLLPFGKKLFVRSQHVQFLLQNFSKDQHCLTATVLNPIDRQNFSSAMRMCDPKVQTLLQNHVNESDATIKFLEIVYNVTTAFLDRSLAPLERIHRMWYSLFFVRIWRDFIRDQNSLVLKDNFLTTYTYNCLELNAHSLVLIMLHLKSIGMPQLFLPQHFDSQPCESFYRQLRSLSSTYSTVTNCSVKEILQRVSKIQLQNEIKNTPDSSFTFYRKSKTQTEPPDYCILADLPSLQEIREEIEKCKSMAIKDALKFDILTKEREKSAVMCQVNPYSPMTHMRKLKTKTVRSKFDRSSLTCRVQQTTLKNFSYNFKHKSVNETSSYVDVPHENKRLILKKTSLCWLLSAEREKLSSDRLYRVRGPGKIRPRSNIRRKVQYAIVKKQFY